MGGYGSTRWHGHMKKTAVEECLVIDISELKSEGVFRDGGAWGEKWWKDRGTGEKNASVSFVVRVTDGASGYVEFFYLIDGETIRDRILLTTTHPFFGGVRYWFACPECSRRIRKLYLPPNETHFACRHCHNLSYESHQSWQRHRRLAQQMGVRVRQVRWYQRMMRNVKSLARSKDVTRSTRNDCIH